MIAPTTRLFGLLMGDPHDAWLARLFNYLFGANGLDAAYVTFLARPDAVVRTLDGLVANRKVERLHVAPAHWRAVARWAGVDGEVDELDLGGSQPRASCLHAPLAQRLRPDVDLVTAWNDVDLWTTRAVAEVERTFELRLLVPTDLAVAVRESGFRPCKLTHDDFVAPSRGRP